MDILVLGAGAVGSYYGGRLAQAGASVSVVARSDFSVVSESGYEIRSAAGDFHFSPENIFTSVQDAGPEWDLVLVALKVLPEIDLPALLAPITGSKTAIFLLQNGINIEAPVAQAFPHNEIISGLAFVCVTRTAPGKIWHQDYGHLAIGNYQSPPTAKTQALAALFQKAGVTCRVDADSQHARWMKLCWNAPYNPLSVIGGGIDTKVIMEDSKLRQLVRDIMEEVMALSRADGHGFGPEHIEQQLHATDNMDAYRPSMLLDYEAGRPMEVEAILGNAVRVAGKLGLDVPRIRTFYSILSILDRNRLY